MRPVAVLIAVPVVAAAFVVGTIVAGPIAGAVATLVTLVVGRIAVNRERMRSLAVETTRFYCLLTNGGMPSDAVCRGTLSAFYKDKEERRLRALGTHEELTSNRSEWSDRLLQPDQERMQLHRLVDAVFVMEVGRHPNELEPVWLAENTLDAITRSRRATGASSGC